MKEPAKEKDERSRKDAEQKGSTKPLAQKIGFERLDLTVEEVEERISPRETNVFDK